MDRVIESSRFTSREHCSSLIEMKECKGKNLRRNHQKVNGSHFRWNYLRQTKKRHSHTGSLNSLVRPFSENDSEGTILKVERFVRDCGILGKTEESKQGHKGGP